jgi:cell division protein FtsZ
MLVEVRERKSSAVLKVIGLGGAGGNAVNRMLESEIRGVEFMVANTDLQALNASACARRIQFGARITNGLGSGGDPAIGRQAAEEDLDALREALHGADMVFITAGMGGGTGTGAAPVVASVARESGALTVAIVSKPFHFEARRRMRQAEEGLTELRRSVDTLIVIPNQRLLHVVDKSTPFNDALRVADDVLSHATKGISEIITVAGLVNVDFADVRSVMQGMGNAIMGMGFASGQDRAREAAQMAISSPLLEDITIAGAQALLVNFMGGEDMTLSEVDEAANEILEAAGTDANMIFGAVVDPAIKDEIRVTLIATGFGACAEEASETAAHSRPPLREVPASTLLSQAEHCADRSSEREPISVTLSTRRATPTRSGARAPSAPTLSGSPTGGRAQNMAAAKPAETAPVAGAAPEVPPSVQPKTRADCGETRTVAWCDEMLDDGIVGPARPISVPQPGASNVETVSRVAGPAPETAAGLPPDNVIPLAWKKNLRGNAWTPRMTSRWQRVLRRERFEVPSFLRRGRQMD